jgi:tRNA U54 and U55 pseudouridine synthase Pus10
MYLDKKEIRNVDLNVLETAVITKLRVLLREKATFERELLGQLNQHNKKITAFESELTSKDSLTTNKLSELIADNKKLTALISSLQNNIKNL